MRRQIASPPASELPLRTNGEVHNLLQTVSHPDIACGAIIKRSRTTTGVATVSICLNPSALIPDWHPHKKLAFSPPSIKTISESLQKNWCPIPAVIGFKSGKLSKFAKPAGLSAG